MPLLLLGMKRGHFFDTFGRRDGIGIEYLPSTSLECVIDGARPQLLDVSFVGGDQGNTFARGDTLAILVQSSASVVINESSPPVNPLGQMTVGNLFFRKWEGGNIEDSATKADATATCGPSPQCNSRA